MVGRTLDTLGATQNHRFVRRMLRILQISTGDRLGGAEAVARNLQRAYRERGHSSWLAVGRKTTSDEDVFLIPPSERDGATPAGRLARLVADPGRAIERRLGIEDFRFPGTWRLLDLPPELPEIVHCHNLHGWYFDLRFLPFLSHQLPVVLTLHDAWLLSGHCAHSFGCERWTTGCGHCPDLTIYPAVRRDATRFNWRRKQRIYARSRLHVSAPARWLLDRAERSMLAPAIVDSRVIPYGIDLEVFRPGDREAARRALGLPLDARVILIASGVLSGTSMWRDAEAAQTALGLLALGTHDPPIVLALAHESSPAVIEGLDVRPLSPARDALQVAQAMRAADVYVHPARADTFPNVILEALACGTPVIATRVGGIAEQVRELGRGNGRQATGILVDPGDAKELLAAIRRVLEDPELRRHLGRNAAVDAQRRFPLDRQVDEYLGWYHDILLPAGSSLPPAARTSVSSVY